MDMDVLEESIQVLRQFKEFSLFREMGGILQKLEDKVFRESSRKMPIIYMEKNEHLKGIEHLDALYQAINKQIVLKIEYQSFKSDRRIIYTVHPYILKEFNNRWFLVGRREKDSLIMTLALDRIEGIDYDLKLDYCLVSFDAEDYYRNTYGVTVKPLEQAEEVELLIDHINAPYVETKPFHISQKIKERHDDGSITIMLKLHNNYEFERLILGFGPGIEVLQPTRLKRRIKQLLRRALENYSKEDYPDKNKDKQ